MGSFPSKMMHVHGQTSFNFATTFCGLDHLRNLLELTLGRPVDEEKFRPHTRVPLVLAAQFIIDNAE